MATYRASTKQLSPKAMRAALEAGRELALQRNSILTVGIGHKHNRRSGYGRKPRIAVKFLVRFKHSKPAARERIPKRIIYRYRGVRGSLPSDVIAVGRVGHHQILSPPLQAQAAQALIGSCGFFAADSSGTQYLVTAGHLLRDIAEGAAVLVGTAVNNGGFVGGVRIGAAYGPAYTTNSDGQVQDVGTVRLDNGIAVPGLNKFPWHSITGLLSEDDLYTLFNASAINCQAFGLNDSTACIIDSILPYGQPFPDLGCYYAPVMVIVRALDGIFSNGDSGAPIVTGAGQLIGIHVVGSDPGNAIGYCVLASSALQILQSGIPTLKPVLGA